eukprot:38911-Chlamydomonas_euryale.AAC.6
MAFRAPHSMHYQRIANASGNWLHAVGAVPGCCAARRRAFASTKAMVFLDDAIDVAAQQGSAACGQFWIRTHTSN